MDFRTMFITLIGLNKFFTESINSDLNLNVTNSPTDSKNILDYLSPDQRKWWLASLAKYDHVKPKQIPNSEKIAITTLLNQARANVIPPASSMKKISWYPELEDALVKFRNNNNGSIFFNLDHQFPKEYPELRVDFLGDHLMELPEFTKFRNNCRMWYHDTNKKMAGKVLLIAKLRVGQKNCIDISKCSALTFNYFFSCLATDQDGNIPAKCVLANRYYADFTDEQYDKFAGLLLGIGGPFTPSAQEDSHWFFACNSAGLRPFINDIPYKIGPSASMCPEEAPIARDKLCLRI